MTGSSTNGQYPSPVQLFRDYVENIIHAHGTKVYDAHLNRHVHELIGQPIQVTQHLMDEIEKHVPLNDKFSDELIYFCYDLENVIEPQLKAGNMRRLVYFNDFNFMNVFQCISLMQFVPRNDIFYMVVYQRSGDVEKLLDDVRFFIRCAELFSQVSKCPVTEIKIFYGSLHVTCV